INIFNILNITNFLTDKIGKPFVCFLGLPKEIVSVIILGFLRKDVSIAMLSPFALSAKQFVVASIFMVLYLPCIASFFILIKEMGLKSALTIVFTVFTVAFFSASFLNFIFTVF
ncbi:MAG: nucleoside recognition domain-containing protein, partial [Elusimicrobiota bacterium]|nr:nucleoside recognition domain-containing protein [Elusimicrobiota bacterium]